MSTYELFSTAGLGEDNKSLFATRRSASADLNLLTLFLSYLHSTFYLLGGLWFSRHFCCMRHVR